MMRYLGVSVALALVAGCGDSGPKLVPVSGTVLLNGEPVEGATVFFNPASNAAARPGVAVTGPGGKYQAMTGGRPGLAAGKYKVGIVKEPPLDLSKLPEDVKNDPTAAKALLESRDPATKAALEAATVRGEFDRDVPPEGGEIDFDVKH